MPDVTTKAPIVIGLSALDRSDEIGQADIGLAVALRELLTQAVEGGKPLVAALAREEVDVVADRVRGPEADHRLRVEPALVDELLEHRLRVLAELARGRALLRVLEDRRGTGL